MHISTKKFVEIIRAALPFLFMAALLPQGKYGGCCRNAFIWRINFMNLTNDYAAKCLVGGK